MAFCRPGISEVLTDISSVLLISSSKCFIMKLNSVLSALLAFTLLFEVDFNNVSHDFNEKLVVFLLKCVFDQVINCKSLRSFEVYDFAIMPHRFAEMLHKFPVKDKT